ncbi:MAG: hypothetical protein ISQ70_13735 [Pirellulales bacterium]|nr:hypothetical protein [Pirellulales bacterium]
MDYNVENDDSDSQELADDYAQVAPEPREASDEPAEPGKINKSAEIRAEASRLIAAGHKPRPVEIVRTLEERGITVAPAQVSILLKKMGVQGRTRRAKTASAKPPQRPSLPPVPEKPLSAPPVVANRPQFAASGEAAYTFEQLLAAKAFVEEVGTPRQAIELLEALDRLLQ